MKRSDWTRLLGWLIVIIACLTMIGYTVWRERIRIAYERSMTEAAREGKVIRQ